MNPDDAISETVIPKRIFIIPYRNRAQHKFFFCKYMNFLLENQSDCEIYFSHQSDTRSFNRGATKNIGFLAVKQKYPNDYKNMTFTFHDIDTMPFHKLFDYSTTKGVVKHYYGFKYALGGIVSINGEDFEKINGFPNFWGWGMEDNVLQKRCEQHRLIIDRNVFYPIGSHEILQLFDGVSRIISKKDPWRSKYDNGSDGIRSIHKLSCSIDLESTNPKDNIFTCELTNIYSFFINISYFLTGVSFENDNYEKYDLRDPPRKIINPTSIDMSSNNVRNKHNRPELSQVDNWTNIPYSDFAEKSEDAKILKEQIALQNTTRDYPPPSPPTPTQTPTPTSFVDYSQFHTRQLRPTYQQNPPQKNIQQRAVKSANIGLGGVTRR